MSIASAIALSGINVAVLRLQVSAGNVANARSNGSSPMVSNTASDPSSYVPRQVVQFDTGQGVAATVQPRSPALVPAYTPRGPEVDARAFATNPYAVLTNEMVQQMVARFNLVANAQVLHADTQLSAALLDITA